MVIATEYFRISNQSSLHGKKSHEEYNKLIPEFLAKYNFNNSFLKPNF